MPKHLKMGGGNKKVNIEGWRYYNHAVIPSVQPHEEPDIKPIEDGSIWKSQGGGTPLLARWTTDWDCGYETNWWYVIKDTPFDIASLKAKRRYEINKGKKNFEVREINVSKFREEMYNVTIAAYSSWPEKYRPSIEKDAYFKSLNEQPDNRVILGAFSNLNKKLCGYACLEEHKEYVAFVSLRVLPEAEKLGINAAIVSGILETYGEDGQFSRYICDGARSISHETNFQDYLEKYFGFRKAYCKLHVVYNPKIKWMIKVLFPFRKCLNRLDSISVIHQINSILYMEELCQCDIG